MQKLLFPFVLLWRIWFYLVAGVPIIIFSPLLLVAVSSEKLYPFFFKIAKAWGYLTLWGTGLFPFVVGRERIRKGKSYILVANHTSMTDIMLMLVVAKDPFAFIGKEELSRIPIFGFFYRRTCILVNRNNPFSRKKALEEASKLAKKGYGICIFPEGGVPDYSTELGLFKDGAFRLAIEHNMPILPMLFLDTKKRHPYDKIAGGPGLLRVKIYHPIYPKTNDNLMQKPHLKSFVFRLFLKSIRKS
ncbi:MAG: lysophospholipid acyltransferase family protein [Flavobacteriaceae bacterium]|nr:lysophospholipid acyltransferase family protein [Flavobacteriaceae bacterium]